MSIICTNSYDPSLTFLSRTSQVALTTAFPADPLAVPVPTPASRLEFVQSTASTSWVWNHNLGYRPTPIVLNLANEEVEAAIEVTNTQVKVFTNPAQVGKIII